MRRSVGDVWTDLLREDPAAPVFDADRHHPGTYGAYGAALLFARCLEGPLRRPPAYVLSADRPPSTYRLLFARPDVDERAAVAAHAVVESHAFACGA